jgi:PRTRC genetic system ThiF family protein
MIVPEYIQRPNHKVSIAVIGAGGTGSNVMSSLIRINATLEALGKPGIQATLIDGDRVSESNIGRQAFYPSDVGKYKSDVLITRINRSFQLNWGSRSQYVKEETFLPYNIIISCVDNMAARRIIEKNVKHDQTQNPMHQSFLWMDFGNSKDHGQAIMVNLYNKERISDFWPTFKSQKDEDDNTPSCSLAEAIEKQDLFINQTLASLGSDLLYKYLTSEIIENRGVFLNLRTLKTQAIQSKLESIPA